MVVRTLLALIPLLAASLPSAPVLAQGAPPMRPSILLLTAELVGLEPHLKPDERLEAEMDAERRLWDAGSLPDRFVYLAAIEGRPAPYDYPHRLVPERGPEVVLTLLDRDRREVRALLELAPGPDGAAAEHYVTIRLNRLSRPAEGKLVVELANEGFPPRWLRIFLRRV